MAMSDFLKAILILILIAAVITAIVLEMMKLGIWIVASGLFFFASLLFCIISFGIRRFGYGMFWLFLSFFSGLTLAHQRGRIQYVASELFFGWMGIHSNFWDAYLNVMVHLTGSCGLGTLLLGIYVQILLLSIHAKKRHAAETMSSIKSKLIGRSPKSLMELMRALGKKLRNGFFTFLPAIIWYGFAVEYMLLSLQRIKPAFLWIPDITKPYGWPPLSPWYAYTILPLLVAIGSWVAMRIRMDISGKKPSKVRIFLSMICVVSIALFLPSGASLFILGGQIGMVIVYLILTPEFRQRIGAVFGVRSLLKRRPEQEQQILERLAKLV